MQRATPPRLFRLRRCHIVTAGKFTLAVSTVLSLVVTTPKFRLKNIPEILEIHHKILHGLDQLSGCKGLPWQGAVHHQNVIIQVDLLVGQTGVQLIDPPQQLRRGSHGFHQHCQQPDVGRPTAGKAHDRHTLVGERQHGVFAKLQIGDACFAAQRSQNLAPELGYRLAFR